MSNKFWRNSFIVFLALFVLTNIFWQLQESPQQAYERGRQDAARSLEEEEAEFIKCWNEFKTFHLESSDSTDTMPAVNYGPPYPWFWSDSALSNDEYWRPTLMGWILCDSFPETCILRYPLLAVEDVSIDGIDTASALELWHWIEQKWK